MTRPFTIVVAVMFGLAGAAAQQPATAVKPPLTGTWTLVSVEQPGNGGRLTALPSPRGLLIIDSIGHIFEGVQHGRPQGAPPLGARQQALATFSGFWGRYRIGADGSSIVITARGAVHPNVQSTELTRTFTVAGDPPALSPTSPPARLTMTAGSGDRAPGTRWTWERVPPVENLSPAYRQVAGFWEHVVEARVNLTTGTKQETTREPSVIVYSPSGYVGVHFPPRGRKPLTSDQPDEEEARAALAGYVGYFGALTVYPGQVFHHPLAMVGLTAGGNTLKRFYAASGDTATITFPANTNAQGQRTTTVVTMKRLSGIAEMMPGVAG